MRRKNYLSQKVVSRMKNLSYFKFSLRYQNFSMRVIALKIENRVFLEDMRQFKWIQQRQKYPAAASGKLGN